MVNTRLVQLVLCRLTLGALCLGVLVTSARGEPRASIITPSAGGCICPGMLVSVRGTSFDTNIGDYAGDRLEFATNPGTGPWTLIGVSSTPVITQGLLYAWSTAGLPPGEYFLRLTANGSGGSTTAISSVRLGASNPATPALLINASGLAGATSFVNHVCFRAGKVSSACGSPLSPTVEARRVGDTAWTLLTLTDRGVYVESELRLDAFTPALEPGEYDLRAAVVDPCAGASENVKRVRVYDAAGPTRTVEINANSCGTFVRGTRGIAGTVDVPDLVSWSLTFQSSSMPAPAVIASGDSPVSAGLLGVWDTRSLAPCAYTLTLRVRAGHLTGCGGSLSTYEAVKCVNVGCPGDFNLSGQVTVQDVFDFLTEFLGACP